MWDENKVNAILEETEFKSADELVEFIANNDYRSKPYRRVIDRIFGTPDVTLIADRRDALRKNQIVGAKQGVLTSDSPLPKKVKKNCCHELADELVNLCNEYPNITDAFETYWSAGHVPLSMVYNTRNSYSFNLWDAKDNPCLLISHILGLFFRRGLLVGPELGLSWVIPEQYPYGYNQTNDNVETYDYMNLPLEQNREFNNKIISFGRKKKRFAVLLFDIVQKVKECPEAYKLAVDEDVLV